MTFVTVTMTFGRDLDTVKMSQCVKYLGQKSLCSKIVVRTHRQTHKKTITLPEPLKMSVITVGKLFAIRSVYGLRRCIESNRIE